ncbi:hypothetical protein HMN09_00802000 [Mycena chlorophos]|uniref:Uncharacterized protein n=1 Tax=Mycena chlorophos TaxID=658473 RepID=A0A8H6W5D1_MYCCL|nr:hypothetical protein HMN09_00802000 [Mycena chlorophos]
MATLIEFPKRYPLRNRGSFSSTRQPGDISRHSTTGTAPRESKFEPRSRRNPIRRRISISLEPIIECEEDDEEDHLGPPNRVHIRSLRVSLVDVEMPFFAPSPASTPNGIEMDISKPRRPSLRLRRRTLSTPSMELDALSLLTPTLECCPQSTETPRRATRSALVTAVQYSPQIPSLQQDDSAPSIGTRKRKRSRTFDATPDAISAQAEAREDIHAEVQVPLKKRLGVAASEKESKNSIPWPSSPSRRTETRLVRSAAGGKPAERARPRRGRNLKRSGE